MATLRDIARENLRNLQEQGVNRLPVDDAARGILKAWCTPSSSAASSARSEISELSTPEQKIDYLRRRAVNWSAARRLGSLREKMVFSVGNVHARLVLVGEAPGYDEERLGEPFVGKAGQKLNEILRAMGLQREQIYITNICKFRPAMGANQGTANRPPTPEEIAACLPLVLAELRAIRPACVVCLGATAAHGLLGGEGSVSSLRGVWHQLEDILPVRVTYHPSYLLRNEALSARRAVWEDMLAVMEKLELPISDKQRGYFLPR